MKMYLSLLFAFQCIATLVAETNFFVWDNQVGPKYWGSIVGGIFYNGPVVWSDLSYNIPDKVGVTTVGTWISRPLDTAKYNVPGGDEYDLYINRTINLGKMQFAANFTYLALTDLKMVRDDVMSMSLRADAKMVPYVTPYIVFNQFMETGDHSPEGGVFIYSGLWRSQPLDHEGKWSLYIDYRIGYSAGVFGSVSGFEYHRIQIRLPIALHKRLTLTPSLIGQIPFNYEHYRPGHFADRERLFWNISLKWVF